VDIYSGEYREHTNTVELLVPTGLKDKYSAGVGDILLGTTGIRSTTRAYITKFPFNYFSGYSIIADSATVLTSYEDFMWICLADIWQWNTKYYTNWKKWSAQYEWTDDVPKGFMHVRLNPDISDYNRAYVVNGLRSYLSINDLLFSKNEMTESLKTLNAVFSLIVGIVGAIAMFIMFYLLLIAMTQNITEAIWEYGVLRSMGLTLAEGRRVYLYEAYTVVGAASIMGCLIGIAAAILISAQLFTFIEMPPVLIFPVYTFLGMMIVAALTTYIAVRMPMNRVNKKQIAAVLKGGA